MKILVRLPNWLGDMVMAAGFINALTEFFPDAEIGLIAKKGIHQLLAFFPPHHHRFIFSKAESPGLRGVWRFGKRIKATATFDLFFSLPDSFSSAVMGYASGSTNRVGYRKEGREFFFTRSFVKQKGTHRVNEYVQLLENYTGKKAQTISVRLPHSFLKKNHLVININSEASSRRLTVSKATEIISAVQATFQHKIYLIGTPSEAPFVQAVLSALPTTEGVESLAGKTSLEGLAELLASARLVLSTDSGPAHLANALGTDTMVLFGAGNENNTAPFNKPFLETLRLGKLSCEPCMKNVCIQFGIPQCLELLEVPLILSLLQQKLNGV